MRSSNSGFSSGPGGSPRSLVTVARTWIMNRMAGLLGIEAVRSGLGTVAEKSQGFLAHVTLAVSADGQRVPLGVLGCELWTRGGARDGTERESLRWARGIEAASDRLTSSLNFKTDHLNEEFVEIATDPKFENDNMAIFGSMSSMRAFSAARMAVSASSSEVGSMLTVVSARPLTMAVRSRVKLQNRYVPTTSLRCWLNP